MQKRSAQSGFGYVMVFLAVLVVAVVAVSGLEIYQHHQDSIKAKATAATNSSQTTGQPKSSTGTQPPTTATQYLTIKEWGVKLPLSDSIKDAYYVIPSGISKDEDGLPSGVYLSVTSLNSSCGNVSAGNTNRSIENAVGEIVRTLPTDTDPVSGKLYTQLNPNGVTIGSYYYAYQSWAKNNPCASDSTLQPIDSAFANAQKSVVTATTTAN